MATLRTFDIEQVKLTLAGVPIVGLAADGIVIEQENDDWTFIEDTVGNVLRSRVPNKTATATINVLPFSDASKQLNEFRNMDKETARFPMAFSLRDFSSGTSVTAQRAFFMNAAPLNLTSEAGVETWTLTLVDPRTKINALPDV